MTCVTNNFTECADLPGDGVTATSLYYLWNSTAYLTSPSTINAAPTDVTLVSSSCYYCVPTLTPTTSVTTSPNALASPKTPPQSGSAQVSTSSATPGGPTTSATGSATKLSNGAVAGIGIVCAVAGALLAGLIVFFLFRRKRQQSSYPEQHLPFNGAGHMGQEKYGMVTTTREVKGATATNIDRLLPLPAEDDAIIGGLSKIRDGIKNHVQNYYYSGPINHEMVDESRLVDLSQATGIPTSALLKFLFNPATRVPTIRLFLGHLILSRCQGRTDGQPSFLPNEVSGLAAYQNSANDANSCKSSLILYLVRTNDPDQAQSALFSKWKTISGVLLQQQYDQQPGVDDVRNDNIAQILTVAEPVLHPFIDPNIDINARKRNLDGVMKRAAQFAFLLFSQPGSFNFDFRGRGQPDCLLVFPAFLQTVSDEAEILSPPRVLSEAEVVSGLGM